MDLDILFYDRKKIRRPFLKIPHPGVFRRLFVLEPLKEIWVEGMPLRRGRLARRAAALKARGQNVRILQRRWMQSP